MPSLPKRSAQTPRLPRHLPVEVIETLEDHAEYSSISASRCKLADQAAAHVLFEQVHFRRASFNRTRLTGLRMFDIRAEASDLSGAVWEQARLRRVEFAGCRLLGVQWLEAELEDALFKDCNLEEAVFASATFKSARFENCLLRGVSFEEANLAEAVFFHCDLADADLRGADLHGADFRGSVINGLQVGAGELQGAIIDSTQAIQVVTLLGVIVKDVVPRP
jgi:uncharacterized protein YjbI with pentapeptide repeats